MWNTEESEANYRRSKTLSRQILRVGYGVVTVGFLSYLAAMVLGQSAWEHYSGSFSKVLGRNLEESSRSLIGFALVNFICFVALKLWSDNVADRAEREIKHLRDNAPKPESLPKPEVSPMIKPTLPKTFPSYPEVQAEKPTVIQQDLHQNIAHVEQIVHPNLREAADHAAYNAEVAALAAGNERSKQTVIKAEAATKITDLQTQRMILEEEAQLESTRQALERVKATPAIFPLSSTSAKIEEANHGQDSRHGSASPTGGPFLTPDEFRAVVTDMEARHGRNAQGWIMEMTELMMRYPVQAIEIRENLMNHLNSAGVFGCQSGKG